VERFPDRDNDVEVVAWFGTTMLDARRVDPARGYWIGSAHGLPVAGGAASVPLVVNSPAGLVVRRSVGEIVAAERTTSLRDPGAPSPMIADALEIAIPRDGEIRVRIGRVDLVIRRVPAAAKLTAPPFRDRRVLGYLASSVAAHLALWLVAGDPAPEVRAIVIEHVSADRPVAVVTPPGTEPGPRERDRSPDNRQHGSGTPLALGAGAAGSTSSVQRTGHIQIERRHDQPQVTRAQAIEAARTAGILGSTAMVPETFTALAGSKDLSSGFDAKDVHAPLYGGTGEAAGGFGLSYAGLLPGAGCNGGPCGTIGVGRYGTISNGTTRGDGWGGRGGGADSIGRGRRHVTTVPTVSFCGGPLPCVVSGGLDKAIVRRYIRRQVEAITYCYEKELLVHPEASGEVAVDFLITPEGNVQLASGQGDPSISACVVGVIQAIQFPRSVSDSTRVHYPFTFRRSGS
jgi:hypothetical protein